MPVSYHAHEPNQICYLTPAPFVSIDKNYDRSGNGQILGVTYTITLNGTLVPDRGSPSTHADASNGFLTDSADKIINDHVHAHAYTDILKKQQLLRKLFSKVNDGGELAITAPFTGEATIKCNPTIVSVTFPEQAPGNIYVQPYTVVLESYSLQGAGVNDPDDMTLQGHELVSAAGENWEISEDNEQVFLNHDPDTGGFLALGKFSLGTFPTYKVSHTISATGKRRFKGGGAQGYTPERFGRDGLAEDPKDGFFNKLHGDYGDAGGNELDGESWSQARDFCRKKLMFGPHIMEGDDSLYGRQVDLSLYGANIPYDITGDNKLRGKTITKYTVYNYEKTQSIGEMDGTFSVTETFDLLPQHTLAVETMQFTRGGDSGHGKTAITINGTIQGVRLAGDSDYDTTAKIDGNGQTKSSGANDGNKNNFELARTEVNGYEKYINAQAQFALLKPMLYKSAQKWSEDSTIIPTPTNSNITRNPQTGNITYSYTFENRKYHIPFCKTEAVSVSDTYPGNIIAQQQVIGRKVGPILQNIGTQGPWKRTMSMNCVVDVDTIKFCIDPNSYQTLHDDEDSCTKNPDGTTSDRKWVDNPNYLASDYSDANAKKPSMVSTIPGSVGTRSQRDAIRSIVDQFTPTHARVYYADTAPQESWDPQSGAWSWTMGWTYELSESYICGDDVDGVTGADNTYPGTKR